MQRVQTAAQHRDRPAPQGLSWPHVLEHCAQSIEYSMDGFPKLKPWIIRATVGRIVAGRFLSRGSFSHDRGGPIPGAPALSLTDADAAFARLEAAVSRFEAHEGPLKEHFVFGRVTKENFGQLHAMHIQDHLAAFES